VPSQAARPVDSPRGLRGMSKRTAGREFVTL
jgi:hypothetical protein